MTRLVYGVSEGSNTMWREPDVTLCLSPEKAASGIGTGVSPWNTDTSI